MRALAEIDGKSLLYWSVIEHHRWWVSDDQIQLHRARAAGGVHDAKSVRRIAKAYAVSRGIRKLDKSDLGASWLADILNKTKWPSTNGLIKDRAAICCRLAVDASEHKLLDPDGIKGVTRGVLVSAMTKLMWFLHPSDWTMFDRYAADGLGIGVADSQKRSKAFYKKLAENGFSDVCRHGNDIIAHSDLAKFCSNEIPVLYMERVIDKYRMFRGFPEEDAKDKIHSLGAYLGVYPTDFRARIEQLADKLAAELQNEPIFNADPLLPKQKAKSKQVREITS